MRRLDDDSRAALRQAAVLGREFDFDLLNAVRGEGEEATLEVIDALLRHGLIVEGRGAMGSSFRFLRVTCPSAKEDLSRAHRDKFPDQDGTLLP